MHALYKLIHYGINHGLIEPLDYDYVFNKLIKKLDVDVPYVPYEKTAINDTIDTLLTPLLDEAVKNDLINPNTVQMRDLFEAEMMDLFTPSPSQFQKEFDDLFKDSSQAATTLFYNRSIHSNYIKMRRIQKNEFYTVSSPYGDIEITINKSKPEKDPRDIAKKQTEIQYPECLLCKENVGYFGHASHPGRSNHRIVKLNLNNEPFYLQFSPYVYYDEHIIVLHEKHIPMQISLNTFNRLFDFVDQFPHYFLGSNAGLPIVGGSILSHEHYQGGKATFPIDYADAFYKTSKDSISIECLNWPLSVLRLKSKNRDDLVNFAEKLRQFYTGYSDPTCELIAHTNGEEHNAINPILRKESDTYILLIALRNNRTNDTFPDGIFHPHPDRHNIKKENIGLIEVMGLAILPGRLTTEFETIEKTLKSEGSSHDLGVHTAWVKTLKEKNIKSLDAIKQEAGHVFINGLEDCGVFKQTQSGKQAFKSFLGAFLAWVS